MANDILIDSSFLYALHDKDDKRHAEAIKFARENKDIRLIPDVILVRSNTSTA